jgi:hypothetical protein
MVSGISFGIPLHSCTFPHDSAKSNILIRNPGGRSFDFKMLRLGFVDDIVAWFLTSILEAGNAVGTSVDFFSTQCPEPCLASWFGTGSDRYLLGDFDSSAERPRELSFALDQLKRMAFS